LTSVPRIKIGNLRSLANLKGQAGPGMTIFNDDPSLKTNPYYYVGLLTPRQPGHSYAVGQRHKQPNGMNMVLSDEDIALMIRLLEPYIGEDGASNVESAELVRYLLFPFFRPEDVPQPALGFPPSPPPSSEVAVATRCPAVSAETISLDMWGKNLPRLLEAIRTGRQCPIVDLSETRLIESLDAANDITIGDEQKPALHSSLLLPNGLLATGSFQGSLVRIWNLHTGKCTRTLKAPGGYVYALKVLPNGLLAVGKSGSGANATLQLWDMDSGEIVKTLRGHTSSITRLAVLPNGHLVSASEDKTIKIWDVETEQCVRTLSASGC